MQQQHDSLASHCPPMSKIDLHVVVSPKTYCAVFVDSRREVNKWHFCWLVEHVVVKEESQWSALPILLLSSSFAWITGYILLLV